jgi:dihydropteroate synthase
MHWLCRNLTLDCGVRPLIMGILNVTPDSFSDGGKYQNADAAVDAALQMVKDGADIIDVGGESTRPGSEGVDVEEELRRVIPVIKKLSSLTSAAISVDTMKAAVAQEALEAGVHIINDVSALTHDSHMLEVARNSGAGVILMHMLGNPRTMQDNPEYDNVVENIRQMLAARIEDAVDAGLNRDTLAIDPGIGFGKTTEHNVRLITHLDRFSSLGRPVVVGLSRKRFIGALTGMPAGERLAGSLAGLSCAVQKGANVMRVHDVAESAQAARVAAAIHNPRVTEALVEELS